MKKTVSLAFFIMLFSLTSLFAAQIKGLVVDKRTGEPLVGANVIIEGTTIGAASDVDGYFVIDYDVQGEFTVLVSYIGYKTVERTFTATDNLSNLVFELEEDYLETDAIVVTGIASKTSKAVAEVSVARVPVERLTEVNNYDNISTLLNGKVAGVKIGSSSGNIGSGFRFDIRSGGGLNGNEQPVIYIDGVRVSNEEVAGFGAGGQGVSILSTLNPDEIENIEILKGPAAAASYGTDGSNGVVLITTKRGKLTGDAKQYKLTYKNVIGYHSQSYEYSKDEILSYKAANDIYRNGWINKRFLSFSGGTGATRYFASFTNNYESGLIPNSVGENQSIRLNLDATPAEKIFVTASASYVKEKIKRPTNDNSIYGWLGNTLLAPTSYNWLTKEDIGKIDDRFTINRFLGSLKATWKPLAFLELNSLVGLEHYTTYQQQFYPPDGDYLVTDGEKNLYNLYNNRYTYDLNAQLSYNIMPELQAKSIIGAQLLEENARENWMTAETFPSPLIKDIGANEKIVEVDETYSEFRKAGIYMENSFSYQDRLYFSLMGRMDYSSALTPEQFKVFYPRASMAIRLDRYGVDLPYVSLLKFRTAYGQTGQLPGFLQRSRFLWGVGNSGWGTGAVPVYVGNEDLKPEKISELELGLDVDILDRASLEFTFSLMNATNSVVGLLEAPSTGITSNAVPFNVGEIDGWSFENVIKITPIVDRNYRLDMTLTNSFQGNEVKDLGGAQPIFDGFDINVIKEGLPKYTFYDVKVLGAQFDETTGEYIGINATDDRVDLGNPYPDYRGSFSFNLDLFNFANLYVLTDWTVGNKMFYYTRRWQILFGNDVEYNNLNDKLATLTPGTAEYISTANKLAKLNPNYPSNFVYDASFFKLREISLSFNITKFVKPYVGNYFDKLMLAFSGSNLWTLTDYPGPDPEVNWSGAIDNERGQDFLTLQHPRTYTMTLRVEL